MSKKLEVNERIYARQVRIIDENGNQKGVMYLRDAIEYARSLGLDLVKIAEANPPVCKVVDAGKYMYDLQKAQKEIAKKQRANNAAIKEVQLRPGIGDNDLKIKARKAKEFLAEGDKVKIVMRFKGRENSRKEIGRETLNGFLAEVGDHKVERPITEAGNEISMMLAPAATKAA